MSRSTDVQAVAVILDAILGCISEPFTPRDREEMKRLVDLAGFICERQNEGDPSVH